MLSTIFKCSFTALLIYLTGTLEKVTKIQHWKCYQHLISPLLIFFLLVAPAPFSFGDLCVPYLELENSILGAITIKEFSSTHLLIKMPALGSVTTILWTLNGSEN